jgi:hypothetical protein
MDLWIKMLPLCEEIHYVPNLGNKLRSIIEITHFVKEQFSHRLLRYLLNAKCILHKEKLLKF